jgi:hypothetical protein
MKTLTSVASRIGFVAAAGVLAAACNATILTDPRHHGSGEGGSGGVGGTGGTGSEGGSGTGNQPPPPSDACAANCESVSGSAVCSCTDGCNATRSAHCEWTTNPLGETKLQCVCTITGLFSGACFEKSEDLACDFSKGCCAKYFLGK